MKKKITFYRYATSGYSNNIITMKNTILFAILIMCFSSCFRNYYRVETKTAWPEDDFETYQENGYRVIVHFKNASYEMSPVNYNDNSLSGGLKTDRSLTIPSQGPEAKQKKNFQYKMEFKDIILSELHIYVNDTIKNQVSYTVTKENFVKFLINKPNRRLSVASHALGVVIIAGVILGTGAFLIDTRW